MRKDLQRFVAGILVLTSGLPMAACQSSTPTPPPAISSGATEVATQAVTDSAIQNLTEVPVAATTLTPAETTTAQSAIAKAVTLDPAQMQDADSKMVGGYIFEPLVGLDKDTTVPWLARKWTVAEDGLACTFELTVDTRFSDGAPLNADVVVENFNRWFDSEDPTHGRGDYKAWTDVFSGFKNEAAADGKPKSALDGIEKTDTLTVILHLNRPMPRLLQELADVNFSIAHQTADGSYVGTGAYAVYEKNDKHLLLVPNPNYTGPYPATDNLEFPVK